MIMTPMTGEAETGTTLAAAMGTKTTMSGIKIATK